MSDGLKIMSQNKECFVNIDNVVMLEIIKNENSFYEENIYNVIAHTINDLKVILGEYVGKERALQILKEIYEYSYWTYYMPEE